MGVFFILPGLIQANPGIYLAVLFLPTGQKISQIFYHMPRLARVKPGRIKKHDPYHFILLPICPCCGAGLADVVMEAKVLLQ